MNLKELSQLDIKDLQKIDYQSLIPALKKRPDILIIFIAVIATLWFSVSHYSGKRKEFSDLTHELTVMKDKEAAYQEYQKAENVLTALKSVLPAKISEASLIEIITGIAEKNNVRITSFSSAKENQSDTYATITLSVDGTAPDYSALWNFVYGIETWNQSIRIDLVEMKAASGDGYRRNRREQQAAASNTKSLEELSFKLVVTGINFNDG
ncbi:MAG TPA: type 4a pilus biogenesis protein PilO [Candidatus Bathyarchaeia archaeon]|nr:type 4a pilus biogenesis protein PilO [Candidatus Bathyarchaeia archaeon]